MMQLQGLASIRTRRMAVDSIWIGRPLGEDKLFGSGLDASLDWSQTQSQNKLK